jgi:c-di-AMP phosphodiesterase-like protein
LSYLKFVANYRSFNVLIVSIHSAFNPVGAEEIFNRINEDLVVKLAIRFRVQRNDKPVVVFVKSAASQTSWLVTESAREVA